jgi:hypothetical protein
MTAQHKPTAVTRTKVETAAGFGIAQEHIADMLGCTEKTLRKHYAKELIVGTPNLINKVAAALFKKASGRKMDHPAVVAAIYLLKARGGQAWRDNHSTVEHLGKDGNPLEGNNVKVVITMPDNGRGMTRLQDAAPPMKLIEGKVLEHAEVR